MSFESFEDTDKHLDELRRYRENSLRTYDPSRLKRDLKYIDEAIDSDVNFEPVIEVGDIEDLFQIASNLAAFIRLYHPELFS